MVIDDYTFLTILSFAQARRLVVLRDRVINFVRQDVDRRRRLALDSAEFATLIVEAPTICHEVVKLLVAL